MFAFVEQVSATHGERLTGQRKGTCSVGALRTSEDHAGGHCVHCCDATASLQLSRYTAHEVRYACTMQSSLSSIVQAFV